MKKALLTLLLLASISNYSMANTSMGVGTSSCEKHNKFLAENKHNIFFDSWVLGFLSGVNATRDKDFLKGTDIDGISQALILYCKNNPMDTVHDAAMDISKVLMNKAKK